MRKSQWLTIGVGLVAVLELSCMSSPRRVLQTWEVPEGGRVLLVWEPGPGKDIDGHYVVQFEARGEKSECVPSTMPELNRGCDYFVVKRSSGLELLLPDGGRDAAFDLGSGKIRCLDGRRSRVDGLKQVLEREVSRKVLEEYGCADVDCLLNKWGQTKCNGVVWLE